jgi:hypothetical protein
VLHPRKLSRIAPLGRHLDRRDPSPHPLPLHLRPGPALRQISPRCKAVRTMYAGATTDDLGKFHTGAAPDFYAFDGERYDGDALMKMVKRNG